MKKSKFESETLGVTMYVHVTTDDRRTMLSQTWMRLPQAQLLWAWTRQHAI